ncbi:GNAT family N-acetyltransferase [Massilia violaceinigra]|uniref:GNAT family N-acetyltransferase n=1 Tax=Massilia violaceinigra TaxID=2045208 RepID=A0A2D2DGU5_9BURK|nr:GNAT family N-acetyltransferase [Massilia violaceinigra]ATQ74175.1 GNAT family N-acetyltransferase [Massilia violaceinigra]
MNIAIETPDQPEVIQLIADLDAYQDSLYPAESRYALDLTSLKQPNVRFAVARDVDGSAIGCGAVVLYDEYVELKRMYVAPAQRGMGVAGKVLALLEASTREAGLDMLMLETGPSQPDALGFYGRAGYERCERYGDYRDDPLSVFMKKRLN